jgi:general secretion pathway protein D
VIAFQVQNTLRSYPDVEVAKTTSVARFGQAKRIIIFGSKSGRALAAELLEQMDTDDFRQRIRRTFPLDFANAEEMGKRIDDLYAGMELDSSYSSSYGYSSTSYRRNANIPKVTCVPDKRRNAITIITDAETMVEVAKLIEEEDTPIDTADVLPRRYELNYADAGELKKLLTDMFSQKERRRSFYDELFGNPQAEEAKTIGRLMGQFNFRVLPSSNVLMVNTTNAEYYKVIDDLVLQLDKPYSVGLPAIVELNHANAEDLCEQLNAILGLAGASSTVRRADRGLDTTNAAASPSSGGGCGNGGGNHGSPGSPSGGNGNSGPESTRPEEMAFWWQHTGSQPNANELPVSNMIGKVRIVPVYQRNALMVLAPPGYQDSIVELVQDLDLPGRQVMIHARVGEIEHDNQTTLGLRIASDPSLLSSADTAIGGSAQTAYLQKVPIDNGSIALSANTNIAALLNLLMRKYDMTILMSPTLVTSDNRAAEYFDGSDVPVQTEQRTSPEGTSTVTNVAYEEVGTRLRIRPHITSNGNVDLLINLIISRQEPGSGIFGNPVFDRREVTTHVIVQNGQTIMLSGIIHKEDFSDVRKVPLLGDLPLIGGIFRSVDKGRRNVELVAFVTPCVMQTEDSIADQKPVGEVMAKPLATLRRIQESLKAKEKAAAKEAQPAIDNDEGIEAPTTRPAPPRHRPARGQETRGPRGALHEAQQDQPAAPGNTEAAEGRSDKRIQPAVQEQPAEQETPAADAAKPAGPPEDDESAQN